MKTVERVAKKPAEKAGALSAQIIWNGQRAARAAAQTAAVRKITGRAAKRGAQTLRDVVQAASATLKAAVASLQSLLTALSAGGGLVMVILIVICLIGLFIVTPFGLFFSGQTGAGENIQTAVSQITGEYHARIAQIQSEIAYDELDMAADIQSAMTDNWKNVLAVYAVRTTTKDRDATEVVTVTEEKKEILRETFWAMNQLNYYTTSRTVYSGEDDRTGTTIVTLHISVTTKDAEEAARHYSFNRKQKTFLRELLSEEYAELFDSLLGTNPALNPLPGGGVPIPGNVSEMRRRVVETGSQLIGRVHYFWGGKSLVLGWDSRWGTPRQVTAAGSPSTGTIRPYGLDCSGFVDWVFYNASGGTYVIGHGGGASAQHRYCTTIPWSEAQPGDLAFYPGDSHVGIIVGYDSAGNVRILHCASGANNVVVTGRNGFSIAARPRILEGI